MAQAIGDASGSALLHLMAVSIGGSLPSGVGIVAEPKDAPHDIVAPLVPKAGQAPSMCSRICDFAPIRDIVFADLVGPNTQITSMCYDEVQSHRWQMGNRLR